MAASSADMERPIRVMIVDDSIVARTVIGRMIEAARGFNIVATAATADAAIEKLRDARVDVIVLDVEMPGTDGLTALPRLIADSDGARVLIVSSACADGAAATVKALTLGAADTLLKPGAGSFSGRFADDLCDRLRKIARDRRRPAGHGRAVAPVRRGAGVHRSALECVAIGASTGGLHALTRFLRALPDRFDVPMLITQHLPPVFIPYFAAQLRDISGRSSSVAHDGALVRRGEILVAPGEAHLRLTRIDGDVRVRLDRAPAASGCLPSVDPMFESLGAVYGQCGAAVVLSGMGRDGASGAEIVVGAGGEVLAQDAESSVVWGMPGVVATAGLADAVLAPELIASRLAARVADRSAIAWR